MSESNKFPTKLVVGGIALVGILLVLYFLVFSSEPVDTGSLQVASSTTGVSSSEATDDTVDTDRILRQLNELRRIRINTDFFNSPGFLNLVDFSVTINPQPVGRDNPFVPATYVPSGDSIVPRANPAVLRPIGEEGEGATNTATTTEEDSGTTTAATSSNNETETAGS